MGPLTGIAIYLTLWWTVLFAVLPLGNRTYAEEGLDVPGGGEPGAPVNPNLKKKFITTTWVAAVLWLILFAVIKFGLVSLPELPANY
jgi:predicted secreted protein